MTLDYFCWQLIAGSVVDLLGFIQVSCDPSDRFQFKMLPWVGSTVVRRIFDIVGFCNQFLRWMLLSLSFWDLLGFFFFGIFGGCHFSRSWDSLLMVKAFLISLGSATKFTWWMLLNLSFWDLLGFFLDSLGFHFSRNWDLLLMVKASLISLGSATKFTKWLLLIGSFSNL